MTEGAGLDEDSYLSDLGQAEWDSRLTSDAFLQHHWARGSRKLDYEGRRGPA